MRVCDEWARLVVTHTDDNCVHGERDANVKTFANHSGAMSQSQDGASSCRTNKVVGQT